MSQFGGKDSKRHFTVVIGNKEHGLYVSSTPSSAAKKAVTKLCAANKSKKVEFCIREITQGSDKKVYGPYNGYLEKLKKPIELKGRVIKYKPVVKLSRKSSKKEGMIGGATAPILSSNNPEGKQTNPTTDNLFNNFNRKQEIIAFITWEEPNEVIKEYDQVKRFYIHYKKLEELKNEFKIFYIDIFDKSRNNDGDGERRNSTIRIGFHNFSKTNKKNENYMKELGIIIDFLKFCIKAKKYESMMKKLKFEFSLQKPDESYTPEFNDFLKELEKILYPIEIINVPKLKYIFKYP